MLAAEDEPGRVMFAVYVRAEGTRGEINFYPDEDSARADVGPGMPPGVLTHGDIYVEYIGEALLFAPADWPLLGVDQDYLIQLQASEGEVFVALTPAESQVLLALAGVPAEAGGSAVAETETPRVPAPSGLAGGQPCAVWDVGGALFLFETGPDDGGRELPARVPRAEFGDEVRSDLAIVRLLDAGWVPLVVDTHTWREVGENWVLNVQPRVVDADEVFLGRFTAADRMLAVTRTAADTDFDEEHLQLLAEDVDCDFPLLEEHLAVGGWRVDSDTVVAADLSVHPELSESPGWYPVESEDGIEWVAAVVRNPESSRVVESRPGGRAS